ncbi:MAG: MFS transporter [Candidatus Kapabacteria bacterium]|nr:MFS transporter [Candidatus Kapabacteria bacterium]
MFKNYKNYFSSQKEHLWKRNLFVLALAQFVAMVGMTACIPFLPLYVRELGVTNPHDAKIWSGYVMGAATFAGVLFAPFWGYIGDKYGRKMMNVRAAAGLTITIIIMGYVTNVQELVASRFLLGALSGIIASALAFVSANTPSDRSGFAIGVLQSSLSAGSIIGPFIGGTIADAKGIRSVFLIIGVLCGISTLLVFFFLKEDKYEVSSRKTVSVLDNLKFIFFNKQLAMLMLLIIFAQAGIQLTMPIFAFFVESLQAPKSHLATITGSLFGTVALFSIMFAPVWGRRNDKKDWRKTVFVSSSICGIFLILHIAMPEYHYLFPLRIVLGIFVAAIIPSLYNAINKLIPSETKGGIMGIASSANMFGTFVAYVSSGYIASFLGINFTFIISGILLISVALIAKYNKPYLQNLIKS